MRKPGTRNRWILACCLLIASAAGAQGYPAKPVRIVIPFAPGGPNDLIARPLAQKIGALWGTSVLVDNVAGANGIIGTGHVARAAADGYTLLMVSTAFTINPSVTKKLTFDPLRDFAPISLVANSDVVLIANPHVPARSVKELIALARAKPGQLTYGSSSTGNSTHLGGELFSNMAKIRMVHVPYKGAAPALHELMGGHIDLVFTSIPPAMPQIHAGKVRAIAVASLKPSFALPDVPTITESGLPGFEVTSRYGLVAPSGTPAPIINRWMDALRSVLGTKDMHTLFNGYGLEPVTDSPEHFARYLSDEITKWAKVVWAAGLQNTQ